MNEFNYSKKTIIISAINIVAGGPLTILNDCLKELSQSSLNDEFQIVALVYSKDVCYFENITYIEFPKGKKRIYSYFMEYYSFKKLSFKINPFLWISLTDKTPNVFSDKLAVYLHSPTPFFKISIKDFIYSPFLLLYVLFYKRVCAINVKKNDYLIVQQNWIRDGYTNLFGFPKSKCIVFPPLLNKESIECNLEPSVSKKKKFLFASLPRGFKNFEIICEANDLLLKRGISSHDIILTLKGNENRYAKSIVNNFGEFDNISFVGVVTPAILKDLYNRVDCLIFPSRLETWGLPISEFSLYNKPMLLADLPYAHNTAAGSKFVEFFNPNNAVQLANSMERLINNDFSFLKTVPVPLIEKPLSHSWEETIKLIINDK